MVCEAEPQEKCQDLNEEVDIGIDDLATLEHVLVRRRYGLNAREVRTAWL